MGPPDGHLRRARALPLRRYWQRDESYRRGGADPRAAHMREVQPVLDARSSPRTGSRFPARRRCAQRGAHCDFESSPRLDYFNGNPNLIGAPIQLNGQAFTVVGVLPPDFRLPAWADLWLPQTQTGDEISNPV